MPKIVLVDNRMRIFEKEYFKKSGYVVIDIPKNKNVYKEISSHVDIFCTKVNNEIFLEPTLYEYLKINGYSFENMICGNKSVGSKYPQDISYNICQIGEHIIHNFKYTDKKILEYIEKLNLNQININQGYSNCSIAVISEKHAIVSDKNIATILTTNDIEALLLEENLAIKLLADNNKFSKMTGFIGGCMSRIGDKLVVFGDLDNLKEAQKIRDFVKKVGVEIIEFKGQELIDYGGVLEI